MKTQENPYKSAVKIYYDGKLDYWETYGPVVKQDLKNKVYRLGSGLCDKIVTLQDKAVE